MAAYVQVNHLTKKYGNGKGIFDVSLEMRQGEVCGLVGVNGSGKTTTLRHLMGFLKPDRGQAYIAGKDCWKDAAEIKKRVGYVSGEIAFPGLHTGDDFLRLQAQYLGMKNLQRADKLAKLLNLDTHAVLKRMSKGMKQKTALVSAFMAEPSVLLLDEPTTGLDPLMRKNFTELLRDEKKKGTTVLMSSPMFDELEAVCDRVAFIREGKILEIVNMEKFSKREVVKEYKIEFVERTDYLDFMAEDFQFSRIQEEYQQVSVCVPDRDIGRLLHVLSDKKLRLLTHNPLTLESYFKKKYQERKVEYYE